MIRRGITENDEQQNNQHKETSETKWQNIRKVVTMVANVVVGYEERKKRNDWYDEECQIKVEERNKAWIKILNRRMRMNTENYKNKRKEAKKMCTEKKKRSHDLKVLEGKEEANKWNEARKTIACGTTASFQPQMCIWNDKDNNLIVNDRLIMERWKHYFYNTLNSKEEVRRN